MTSSPPNKGKSIQILLVEDNPGDVRLTIEVFKDAKIRNALRVVRDGSEALAYLRREGEYGNAPRPDLILLDLNLPKKDGRDLLSEIKEDPDLQSIPVVVLTGSDDDADILKTYDLQANSYILKPIDINRFIEVISSIEGYWLDVVKLPPGPEAGA